MYSFYLELWCNWNSTTVMILKWIGIANSRVAEVNSLNMGKLPGLLFFFLFVFSKLTVSQVERKWCTIPNIYLHIQQACTEARLWKPLSAVGKHCDYMLKKNNKNDVIMRSRCWVQTLHKSCHCIHLTCVAYISFPQLRSFLSTWGVMMNSLGTVA